MRGCRAIGIPTATCSSGNSIAVWVRCCIKKKPHPQRSPIKVQFVEPMLLLSIDTGRTQPAARTQTRWLSRNRIQARRARSPTLTQRQGFRRSVRSDNPSPEIAPGRDIDRWRNCRVFCPDIRNRAIPPQLGLCQSRQLTGGVNKRSRENARTQRKDWPKP